MPHLLMPVTTLIIPLCRKSISLLSSKSRLISILFYFCAFIRIFIDCKFIGLFVLLQIFIEIYYDSYERSTLKALQFVCFRICLDFISSLVERYF